MSISFDKALGIHETALAVRTKRAEVLANNLVNTDTPNFKARDIDFQSVLKNQMTNSVSKPQMLATNSRHIAPSPAMSFSPELMYRVPLQPSLDGNTVEEQVELGKFAKNTMDTAASFHFLNSKFSGLKTAIKGTS